MGTNCRTFSRYRDGAVGRNFTDIVADQRKMSSKWHVARLIRSLLRSRFPIRHAWQEIINHSCPRALYLALYRLTYVLKVIDRKHLTFVCDVKVSWVCNRDSCERWNMRERHILHIFYCLKFLEIIIIHFIIIII